MPTKLDLQRIAAETEDLRGKLERAEESLRQILSGDADALFVAGAVGAQIFVLKGTDQSYRTLIENMSEGALTLDPEGLILYANRRFAEMLRAPLETVIGSDIHTWFAPESRRVLRTLWRKDAADNRRMELALFAADGTEVPVNLSVSHLLPKGANDSVCMIATDLSEQKRNEAFLAGENLSNAILGQAADAIVICDEAGRIMRASKQAQEFCGNNPVGQNFEQAFPLRWPDGSAPFSLSAIDTSGRQSVEATLERIGQKFDLLVSVGHLTGLRNELLGSVVTLTNITERKRMETELRESERRFSEMLGNVDLVSSMRDVEGRITYCNEYLLRLTGWRYEEVIGRDWIDVFVPAEIIDKKKDMFAALLAGSSEARHHESEILTRTGKRRLIHWNHSVLRSGAGDVIGTASIGEDITEQKQAEISIRRLNRVYAVLSGINSVIVRIRNRDELFQEACQIAVEAGGFRMALLVIVDRSAMTIVPVASAGKDKALLAKIGRILSSTQDAPKTMVARALRERRAIVSNDSQSDPQVLFGTHYVASGVRSMAVLPLMVSDDVVGALALYSSEIGFFHDGEMKLLTELTGDITFAIDHLDKQARLEYLAYYDVLTGLANRSLFLERVAQHLSSAVSGEHRLAVLLIDLERFKNINDSLGRAAGDALLMQVADWLKASAGDASLLARVDADHFAAVMPKVKQLGDVAHSLEKWMASFLEHPFRLNDAVFRISAKIGIAVFPDDGTNADMLFRNAEAALKKAKASGERFLFYTQQMTESVAVKLSLENRLHQALDNEEFVLHYQPKVDLTSGRVTGAEALIRWNDPRIGLVPPGRFIPVLEETGLIHDVGRWALKKAIEEYLRWRALGLPAVRIAVNVSPLQLRHHSFVPEVSLALAVDAHAAAGLELEITEGVIMADAKHSIAVLRSIRATGVTIAIDDFGTGFSSLSYLARLPVDTLKIDRSFVTDITVSPEGLALVSTIINLAHSLKLKVVAEGVETLEQSRLLRLRGCDEMQGFLFSKAVPADVFVAKFLTPQAGQEGALHVCGS